MKKIDESCLCILRKCNENKGLVFVSSWLTDKDISLYHEHISVLKNSYFIIGLTTGSEVIRYSNLHGDSSLLFNLYAAPNAAYAQHVMVNTLGASAKTFIFHKAMAKTTQPKYNEEKIYDAIAVMSLNMSKLWGIFLDLAEKKPDYRFLAVIGQSDIHGIWDYARDNYQYRIAQLPNVTRADNVAHKDLLKLMAKSKCFIHICDYDAAPMSTTEAMSVNTPVMINSNCSSGIKSLIRPQTGIFFKIHEIEKKFDLMMHLVSKGFFKAKKGYFSLWGFDNSLNLIKKYVKFYGLGDPSEVTFPHADSNGINIWHMYPGYRVNGLSFES